MARPDCGVTQDCDLLNTHTQLFTQSFEKIGFIYIATLRKTIVAFPAGYTAGYTLCTLPLASLSHFTPNFSFSRPCAGAVPCLVLGGSVYLSLAIERHDVIVYASLPHLPQSYTITSPPYIHASLYTYMM